MSGLRSQTEKDTVLCGFTELENDGILWMDKKTFHYNITAPIQREVFHSQQQKGESVDHS